MEVTNISVSGLPARHWGHCIENEGTLRAHFVQGVYSNVLANLIAASFIYLVGVGVGLLPRQSESVALSSFVVFITAGVVAEVLGGPIYRRIRYAAAASSCRLITLAAVLLASGLSLISSVFILRGSIDVWRLLLFASFGAVASVAGIRVLPSELAYYRRARRGPVTLTPSANASSVASRMPTIRRRRSVAPRRKVVAGRRCQ